MKRTRKQLKRVWDIRLAYLVNASYEKFEAEIKEHGALIKWICKNILLPASLFYVIVGLLTKTNVFDSLFLGFIIFIYSNFVPDLDSILVVSRGKRVKENLLERFGLLFFGPLFVYYAVSGEARPIFVKKPKEFHSVNYLLLYSLFLLVVGLVFYGNVLEQFSLPFFGAMGYAAHLAIDRSFRFK